MPLPPALRHAARRNVVERLEKLQVMLPTLDRKLVYDLAMTSWTPWEIHRLLGTPTAARSSIESFGESFPDQMARTDLRHFLPDDILVKVDRATMACGLEGREPFLDHRLMEFALRLPLSMLPRRDRTNLLRRVLYRYVPALLLERQAWFAIPLAAGCAAIGAARPPLPRSARISCGRSTRPWSRGRSQTSARAGRATTGSTCRSSGT